MRRWRAARRVGKKDVSLRLVVLPKEGGVQSTRAEAEHTDWSWVSARSAVLIVADLDRGETRESMSVDGSRRRSFALEASARASERASVWVVGNQLGRILGTLAGGLRRRPRPLSLRRGGRRRGPGTEETAIVSPLVEASWRRHLSLFCGLLRMSSSSSSSVGVACYGEGAV